MGVEQWSKARIVGVFILMYVLCVAHAIQVGEAVVGEEGTALHKTIASSLYAAAFVTAARTWFGWLGWYAYDRARD